MMDGTPVWHGTTILSIRKGDQIVIAGDGQVSLGDSQASLHLQVAVQIELDFELVFGRDIGRTRF